MATPNQPLTTAGETSELHASLPPLGDLLETLHVVRLRLNRPFRGLTHREAALVRGPAGWAEFAPFTEYGDHEAAAWMRATLEVAAVGYPAALRDQVAINATVPAIAAAEVPSVLARFEGATTAKIKVAEHGQELRHDVERVAACRDALGDDAHLRIDANGGWTPEQAREALTQLAPYGLEYAEQPVMDVSDLAHLTAWSRDTVQVPIAADESVRKVGDPLAVARAGASDVAIVKMPPLGGPQRALHVAHELGAYGVKVVFSSALDTTVGLAAGIATAAAMPGLEHACGLGTAGLFAEHITEPLLARGGHVAVLDSPPEPDPELLTRYAAPQENVAWWRDRFARVHALAAPQGNR